MITSPIFCIQCVDKSEPSRNTCINTKAAIKKALQRQDAVTMERKLYVHLPHPEDHVGHSLDPSVNNLPVNN